MLLETRNIYAVGRNYADHIKELGNLKPAEPVIFNKALGSLARSDQLRFPPGIGPVHHEIEVVLRIGESVAVGAFESTDCVSHVGLGLDFTARDLQTRLKREQLPWHLAKSFADACYVAPLRLGFAAETVLDFSLWVDGERRQHGRTDHMIFDYPSLLAFINRTLPLAPGDLIFTGTPAGVGPVVAGNRLRLVCSQLAIDQEVTIADGP